MAMSKPLPTHGFRWLSRDEINRLDIDKLNEWDENGYILEVDLEYPAELHDKHNDYPLAAEHLTISGEMLSSYQKSTFPKEKLRPTEKLTPNLLDKTRYTVHYSNLKYYLAQGLKLTRIHRALTFKQSAWLKPYVEFNSQQRALATSDFEKNFFKLMNNAVFGMFIYCQDRNTPLMTIQSFKSISNSCGYPFYFSGKTQENLRNRVNIEVVTNEDKALKRVAKPSFKRSLKIRNDMVLIQTHMAKVKLNRPIYVGFTVLETSKLHMAQFHYDKMLQWFDDITLCFTDTGMTSVASNIKLVSVIQSLCVHD